MKKLTAAIIALAAATLATAGVAWAQRDLLGADANSDGAISRAEVQTAREAMFDRLDADHDGYISTDERRAAAADLRQRRSEHSGRGPGMMGADTDHDGRISRAEAQSAHAAMFDRVDANHDGFISADERGERRGRRGRGGGLARADADHDGRISRAEFTAQPTPGFDRLDADHNGVASRAEIDAARDAAQRRHR